MEYLLGSAVTLVCIFIAYIVLNNHVEIPTHHIKYSQSHINRIISPLLPDNNDLKVAMGFVSQARNHRKSIIVNVIVVDEKAYWIKNNTFFYANVIDGEINTESAKEVDIMGMDKVELDKMVFIVERLAERNEL